MFGPIRRPVRRFLGVGWPGRAVSAAAILAVLVLGGCELGGTETVRRVATLPPPPPSTVALKPERLELVLNRGRLSCGVSVSRPGFSSVDGAGNYDGLEVDFCRALAAAVLGNRGALDLVPLSGDDAVTALAEGRVDVLLAGATLTQAGDVQAGLDFAAPLYFDGQQLLGHSARGFSAVSDLGDLRGAVVCVHAGSDAERRIAASAEGIRLSSHVTAAAALAEFAAGNCDALTNDGSDLVAAKAGSPDGTDWALFPARSLTVRPLAAAVEDGQSRFADAVRWTLYALLIAEEHGINSQNLDIALIDASGELARIFGVSPSELQSTMGIPHDAFYQAVSQVGNYGEIFQRNLGRLGIARGWNGLYRDGGLHYPAPVR
jgi:general L-amino acid transport system substrate-binding protein